MKNSKLLIAALIFFGIVFRLLPHEANFAPVGAIALFSGTYFSKRYALLVPLVVMLITDIFLGYHSTIAYVYVSLLLITLVGSLLKSSTSLVNIVSFSLASSLLFFFITNFGVWATGNMYSKTLEGLIECYALAIPFFRNTILSDLMYSGVLFGGLKLLPTKLSTTFSLVTQKYI